MSKLNLKDVYDAIKISGNDTQLYANVIKKHVKTMFIEVFNEGYFTSLSISDSVHEEHDSDGIETFSFTTFDETFVFWEKAEIWVDVRWTTSVNHIYESYCDRVVMSLDNFEHQIDSIVLNLPDGSSWNFTDDKDIRDLLIKQIVTYEN